MFKVCEPNILSDHCALEFTLCKDNSMHTTRREESESGVHLDKKIRMGRREKRAIYF